MEVALMVMDGSKTGKADPAFAAHMDVALHWAQAIWNNWLPVQALQQSVDYARERISSTSRLWAVVTGPAAALICTLERIGWSVISATELESDDGRVFLNRPPGGCQTSGRSGGPQMEVEKHGRETPVPA